MLSEIGEKSETEENASLPQGRMDAPAHGTGTQEVRYVIAEE